MIEGGVVLVARQLDTDQGRFQHQDPKAEHYVSIRSSRAGARFEPTKVPLPGCTAGSGPPTIRVPTAGRRSLPGDTVTVTYGDQSGGSRGFGCRPCPPISSCCRSTSTSTARATSSRRDGRRWRSRAARSKR